MRKRARRRPRRPAAAKAIMRPASDCEDRLDSDVARPQLPNRLVPEQKDSCVSVPRHHRIPRVAITRMTEAGRSLLVSWPVGSGRCHRESDSEAGTVGLEPHDYRSAGRTSSPPRRAGRLLAWQSTTWPRCRRSAGSSPQRPSGPERPDYSFDRKRSSSGRRRSANGPGGVGRIRKRVASASPRQSSVGRWQRNETAVVD